MQTPGESHPIRVQGIGKPKASQSRKPVSQNAEEAIRNAFIYTADSSMGTSTLLSIDR